MMQISEPGEDRPVCRRQIAHKRKLTTRDLVIIGIILLMTVVGVAWPIYLGVR